MMNSVRIHKLLVVAKQSQKHVHVAPAQQHCRYVQAQHYFIMLTLYFYLFYLYDSSHSYNCSIPLDAVRDYRFTLIYMRHSF